MEQNHITWRVKKEGHAIRLKCTVFWFDREQCIHANDVWEEQSWAAISQLGGNQ